VDEVIDGIKQELAKSTKNNEPKIVDFGKNLREKHKDLLSSPQAPRSLVIPI